MKRNIYLMYAIALLQGMVFYGPVATLYRAAQGVSVLEITVIESISLVLCLVLELPWGILADKIGYRRTMLVCCALYFVTKIIFWQATNFAGFLAERVLLSAVIAGLSGVDTSVLFLSSPPEKSQQVFGVYNALNTAGLLAAAVIYTTLLGSNYKLAGFLTVLSYGAAALLALFLREVKPEAHEPPRVREFFRLLRQVLKNGHLLLFLLGVALFNEAHQTVTVFLNQLQYVRSGLSPAAIGIAYIAMTVVGLGGVFSARLTRKTGALQTLLLCSVLAAAACLTLALTQSAVLSVLCILLLRAVFHLLQPLQSTLQNRQVFTNQRATALSINAVLIDSVGVGTNLCFGALAEQNLPFAFFFGAALCAAAAVCFIVWDFGTKHRFTAKA